YHNQTDDKKENTMNIVDAEIVDDIPSNCNEYIKQFTNTMNNNISSQPLPPYVEIINNNTNSNDDINDKDDNKILSTSESS
ncbi:hypothetical protein PIROE2DRAFT_15984, partial [Piromyces sp. E2]